MREILFHGKRMDNGQWVEAVSILSTSDGAVKEMYIAAKVGMEVAVDPDGNLHAMTAGPHVAYYRVDPKTVGQFTGLTDKNGRKVFEGDIIRTDNGKQIAVSVVKFGEYYPQMFYRMLDMFCPGKKHLLASGFYAESLDNHECMILFQSPCVEVIGNIYDNPELLEE